MGICCGKQNAVHPPSSEVTTNIEPTGTIDLAQVGSRRICEDWRLAKLLWLICWLSYSFPRTFRAAEQNTGLPLLVRYSQGGIGNNLGQLGIDKCLCVLFQIKTREGSICHSK